MPTKRKSPAAGKKNVVRKATQKNRGPSDGYDYDFFISYRCEDVVKPFVREHLVPLLSNWLSLKKNGWKGPKGKPRIFLDDSDIQGGQLWKKKIMAALPKSKVMVGCWTPAYFESKWCEAEYRHFRARYDDQLKTDPKSKSLPILVPIRLADGDYFSKAAGQHQIKHDLSPFLREGFRKDTALWSQFEESVIVLAEYLVQVIDSGLPPFKPFPVDDPDKIRIKPLPYKGGKPTI